MPLSRLDDLWSAVVPTTRRFAPGDVAHLPEPARRYLTHALAPGAPLATAIRLRMDGELRLGGAWHPMSAEQVTVWSSGFRWEARVRLHGVPITGFDQLLGGAGAMRWKAFGLVPFLARDCLDVTRSAAGRMNGEAVWLPGVLLDDDVRWSATDASHAEAVLRAHDETTRLDLTIDDVGALRSLAFTRWGDAGGQPPHEDVFGGRVLAEATFQGVTIPSRVELGWWPSTDRFDAEGAFFRATVTAAELR